MSETCERLHEVIAAGQRLGFPFLTDGLPEDGVYIVFERGEWGHRGERIVRVGTHTGQGRLRSRLVEHFLNENKDRSKVSSAITSEEPSLSRRMTRSCPAGNWTLLREERKGDMPPRFTCRTKKPWNG